MDKSLSASRIKTLQSCSWTYWCSYVLKLPRSGNAGMYMGSCCHNVFECLGNPRHFHHYDMIIASGTILASPTVTIYVTKFLKKNGMSNDELVTTGTGKGSIGGGQEMMAFDLVDKMILEGLNYDFYGEDMGADSVKPEIEFNIEHSKGNVNYKIRGFIDQLFIFKEKREAVIRDWKSSKKKFKGIEIDDNVQDLMYQLAVRHLYPELLKRRTEFVFLQFECPDNGVLKTPFVEDRELDGFEHYLSELQILLDNFTIEDAKKNFAADKGFVSSYNGFGGLIKCGVFPSKSSDSPSAKKNDGSPMWFCEHKFAYHYYVILDSERNIKDSQKDKKDLAALENGQTIEKRFYEGCPKFQSLPYNKEMNKKALDNSSK